VPVTILPCGTAADESEVVGNDRAAASANQDKSASATLADVVLIAVVL
jgi:hypothetical protein